jgi:kelch-like protein 2/3
MPLDIYRAGLLHPCPINEEALSTRKITHPFLSDIHDLHTSLINDGKSIVFIWVPSHMGIKGNDMADQAAKEAFKHEVSKVPAQFIPPEDLKRSVKVYIGMAGHLERAK